MPAAETIEVSWFTRTLPTVDIEELLSAGPPAPLAQEQLKGRSSDDIRTMMIGKGPGSRFDGLIWHDGVARFAAVYVDRSSSTSFTSWPGPMTSGSPSFPLGAGMCGQVDSFAWDGNTGNITVVDDGDAAAPHFGYRLRDIELVLQMHSSPQAAVQLQIDRMGADGVLVEELVDATHQWVWRSNDGQLSLTLKRQTESSLDQEVYSWHMIAIDESRELGTVTHARVRTVNVDLLLPASHRTIAGVYETMVPSQGLPRVATVSANAISSPLEIGRMLFGVFVLVAFAGLIIYRKGPQ